MTKHTPSIKDFKDTLFSLFKYSRASLLGALSSAFEWYDYALFGYFTLLISQQFFPASNPLTALLSSFAVFASGFAMRPLGAILFGYIGDRIGRKRALILSLVMMAIPTVLLGLLPTYNMIGFSATIMLVIIRLLQGLAVGGNYGGSFIYTIEQAPKRQKSLAGSIAMFGTLWGLFLGSGVAFLCNLIFTPEQLTSFGWRIPFLLGGFSVFVAHMLRKSEVAEHPIATPKQKESDSLPLKAIWESHISDVLKAIGIILLDGVGVYVLFVFMTTYATVFLGLPSDNVLLVNTLGMACLVTAIPIFGYLGDIYTPQRILKYVSLGFLVCSLPLFYWLVSNPSILALSCLQGVFAILVGAAYGALPSTVVGIFPRHIRYTGCGLSFNISVGVFGGTAPFVVTGLIHLSGLLIVPGIILTLVGVFSFLAVKHLKKEHD